MKHNTVWIIVCMFIALSCGKDNFEETYLRAETLFRQGNLTEASGLLRNLIYQPGSPSSEKSYRLLDSVLSTQERRRFSFLESQRPHSEGEGGKGTITLTLGYVQDSLLQTIADERIRLSQTYLTVHPQGSETEHFVAVLVSDFGYVPENLQESVSSLILREATESKRGQFIALSGWLFHSRGNYNRAMDRYNNIIQGSDDPGTKTLFRLYLVDCLYQLGRFSEARQALTEAVTLSPDKYRPMAEGMASHWRAYLKEAEKDPSAKKKALVYFQ